MVKSVSPQGVAFSGGNEGFVSHYYKDSGGVGTIGHGFTWMSKAFRDYWMKTRGHKLRAGDTITKAESLQVLAAVIADEYAPPVVNKYGSVLLQNEFDAVTDTVYNCGPGTLKDRWAVALAGGSLATAAADLLTTRITAGGRVLAGLKSRRSKEVNLLVKGDYNGAVVVDEAPAQAAAAARAATADKAKSIAKATAPVSTAGGAATHVAVTKGAGAAASTVGLHTLYVAAAFGLGALAVIGIGYLIYAHRGVILRKRTPA